MTEIVSAPRRIQTVSRFMVVVTAVLAVLLVAVDVWLWLSPDVLVDSVVRRNLAADVQSAPGQGAVIAVLLVAQLSFGLGFWALWNTFVLFRGYVQGAVFTIEAGRRLRMVGVAFCAMPFVAMLVSAASTALLTLGNAPGERHVAISLEGTHLIIGVAGALMIVVGWVLSEAASIAEDNRQIV